MLPLPLVAAGRGAYAAQGRRLQAPPQAPLADAAAAQCTRQRPLSNVPCCRVCTPPGDTEQLDNHAEVVMHDFAACLLAELERWMLNASPAMVELSTLVRQGWTRAPPAHLRCDEPSAHASAAGSGRRACHGAALRHAFFWARSAARWSCTWAAGCICGLDGAL